MAEMMGAAFDIGDPEFIHRRNMRREMLEMMDGVYSDYDDYSPPDSIDWTPYAVNQPQQALMQQRTQRGAPEQPNNDPARVSSNGQ